ncbi:hypothetical protein LEL_09735 [Akanthomyces lecanii RCEF 1005]|uniref:Uncharacterized protein n=1 Tax=Akanthomyces lecanii RCEF 1005 TaxID=1081108 RepID=A0A162MT48_CORDF|nr:hypothetical protein LEL_09735 [Akanthomyces lecanii RCEF 1005]
MYIVLFIGSLETDLRILSRGIPPDAAAYTHNPDVPIEPQLGRRNAKLHASRFPPRWEPEHKVRAAFILKFYISSRIRVASSSITALGSSRLAPEENSALLSAVPSLTADAHLSGQE